MLVWLISLFVNSLSVCGDANVHVSLSLLSSSHTHAHTHTHTQSELSLTDVEKLREEVANRALQVAALQTRLYALEVAPSSSGDTAQQQQPPVESTLPTLRRQNAVADLAESLRQDQLRETQERATQKQQQQQQQTAQGLAADGASWAQPERQAAVRGAMKHAWDGYVKYAWGQDDLKPLSHKGTNWLAQGATIVDSLDTLYIMGMMDEFQAGRDWVVTKLDLKKNRGISLFETNIRVLGGLLAAYDQSKDPAFLPIAEDLARGLLKSYRGGPVPYATVNLATGAATSPSWTGGSSILSEIGTLQLEFLYLARVLNKPELAAPVMETFKHLDLLDKSRHDGLYPLYVRPPSGGFSTDAVSIGALGDSFYEYLLKAWLLTGRHYEGFRRMYEEATDGINKRLVQFSAGSNLTYLAELGRSSRLIHKMDHLVCFAGGMYALGAATEVVGKGAKQRYHMDVGRGLTHTCNEMYVRMPTGIAPEFVEFTPALGKASTGKKDDMKVTRGKHYLLRPETVESFFVLYRLTGDRKYQDWGWAVFEAIERECRVDSGGYSGIRDVTRPQSAKDDTQQSFFLAETLKYLYLLFSPRDLVPLDKYVFNTEAHPLSVFPDADQWSAEFTDHFPPAHK
jgi:Glycosyl hydrolase family 47